MAGILPSTPEAARAEIERLLVELLADVPGLDISPYTKSCWQATDSPQIVHMTNGNSGQRCACMGD